MKLLRPLACLLLCAAALIGAEPSRAAELVAQGQAAMRAGETEPMKMVEAAVAFAGALKEYEKAGDEDGAREMRANLYWCKKKMPGEVLAQYVKANKGGDTKALIKKVDEVAEAKVDAGEAQGYFDRAEAFAKGHPDQQMQITIRWFEVAGRFKDTTGAARDLSLKAQELSQQAQQAWLKQATETAKREADAAAEAARMSIFSKPSKAANTSGAEVPKAEAVAPLVAALKKTYATDYAKTKPAAKRAFATRLLKEGDETKDDAAGRWALYGEAQRLAAESGEARLVIDSVERMAKHFTGVDRQVELRKAFGRMSGTNGSAMVRLVDQPEDPAANTTAGRYLCYDLRAWDLGLPMLAKSSDAALKKAADMELARPSGSAQLKELADAWYDIGRKTSSGEARFAPYARALGHYQEAMKQASGLTKTAMQQRIDEIEAALPLTSVDWDKLTDKQWDKVQGQGVVVEARKMRNETGIVVPAGRRVRIVPHPSDTWSVSSYSGRHSCTWRGKKDISYYSSDILFGALVCAIGSNGPYQKPGVIVGGGQLYFGAYTGGSSFANAGDYWYGTGAGEGKIRVKIVPVEDE